MKIYKMSFLASALLMGGCAKIGDDYKKPQINQPLSFAGSEKTIQDTQVNREWWRDFDDSNLNELVKLALQNNNDLLSSTATVDAMLGRFDQMESYLYPQINANA